MDIDNLLNKHMSVKISIDYMGTSFGATTKLESIEEDSVAPTIEKMTRLLLRKINKKFPTT